MNIEYRNEVIFENETNDFYNNKNIEYRNEIIFENELYDFYYLHDLHDLHDINILINLFCAMKIN